MCVCVSCGTESAHTRPHRARINLGKINWTVSDSCDCFVSKVVHGVPGRGGGGGGVPPPPHSYLSVTCRNGFGPEGRRQENLTTYLFLRPFFFLIDKDNFLQSNNLTCTANNCPLWAVPCSARLQLWTNAIDMF